MGKPKNVVPMTLSVRKELKAKIDAMRWPVNWSAIASAAFEAKLLELESKKEVKEMKDVIARWKAADELDRKEEYQAGHEAGERWAKEHARPKQLRALASIVSNKNFGRANFLSAFAIEEGETANQAPIHGESLGFGWALAQAIAGKLAYMFDPRDLGRHGGLGRVLSEMDIALFWTKVLGENWKVLIEEHSFAQGFLEGALDVWENASCKL